jgi:hypothetical protein
MAGIALYHRLLSLFAAMILLADTVDVISTASL